MCAACGVPTHVPLDDVSQPAKFAALRNPTCRVYLLLGNRRAAAARAAAAAPVAEPAAEAEAT